MEFYRKIKIPDEAIEGLGEGGLEGEYAREYLLEPEHIREGVAERPEWEPFRMTASAVMRVALLNGLDQLESEMKGSRRA